MGHLLGSDLRWAVRWNLAASVGLPPGALRSERLEKESILD